MHGSICTIFMVLLCFFFFFKLHFSIVVSTDRIKFFVNCYFKRAKFDFIRICLIILGTVTTTL